MRSSMRLVGGRGQEKIGVSMGEKHILRCLTMSSTLPYSVSTGSAFNAFDKLHGIKNYPDWRDNMQTMLMSLRQWGLIDRSVTRPVPLAADNITPQEATDIAAYDLRAISAYQEIKFRVGDTTRSV